ncbi:MAG: response regulator transcription factor [Chloroflexi bacterium]|nr:response regulator transcription factor [Chloroflexota bacterium]
MQRILIVDDEPSVVDVVRSRFEREGFAVGETGSGEDALVRLRNETYDLLILDIGLPGIDGFGVLRQMRAEGFEQPVIMLTARADEVDRVVGLELGADDYVVKPFSPRELVARVRALLRRTAEASRLRQQIGDSAPTSSGLQLDNARRRATFRDVQLTLRPKEFDLLAYLASHPGQVFTREVLLGQVWGYDEYVDARTVDVHIRRLRSKLSEIDAESNLIQTEWGIGYRFIEG